MAGNPNYDRLVSSTLKRYIPVWEDVIMTSKPLLWALKNFPGAVRGEPGGTHIVQPLLYAKIINQGSYSGADTFATDPDEGHTAAEFPWKQYYSLISITGIDEAKNSGPQAVLNLVKAELDRMELSIAEAFDEMFFGTGAGNANKDWNGLAGIVDSADPSWGSLGGIARATNTWWQAQETAMGGALTEAAMRTMYNDCSSGNDHPTNIFTTQTLFENVEAFYTGLARYENPKMVQGGFENLQFKASPITFDDYCTSGVVYFTNLKYLHLVKHSKKWMYQGPWQEPINQDVAYKKLLCYGNLTVSNPSRQGKITGAT